jgi:hypothetical protein
MGYASAVFAKFGKGSALGSLYMNVYTQMFKHHFPNGYVDHDAFWGRVYNVLSPGERAILFGNEFFNTVYVDGLAGYFDNGNFAHAHEMVRLLRRIGNNRAADFLQRAVEIAGIPDPLPQGYEYFPTKESYEALDKYAEENRAPSSHSQLQPLIGLEESLDEYVRLHPEEFGESAA